MTEKNIGNHVYGPEDRVVSAKLSSVLPSMMAFPSYNGSQHTHFVPSVEPSAKAYENVLTVQPKAGTTVKSVKVYPPSDHPTLDAKRTTMGAIKEWSITGEIATIPNDLYLAFTDRNGYLANKQVAISNGGFEYRGAEWTQNYGTSPRCWSTAGANGDYYRHLATNGMVYTYPWFDYWDLQGQLVGISVPISEYIPTKVFSLYYDTESQSFKADVTYQTTTYGNYTYSWPGNHWWGTDNFSNLIHSHVTTVRHYAEITIPEEELLCNGASYLATVTLSSPPVNTLLDEFADLTGSISYVMWGTTITLPVTYRRSTDEYIVGVYNPDGYSCAEGELDFSSWFSANTVDMSESMWRGRIGVLFAPAYTFQADVVRQLAISSYDVDGVPIGKLVSSFIVALPNSYVSKIYGMRRVMGLDIERYTGYGIPEIHPEQYDKATRIDDLLAISSASYLVSPSSLKYISATLPAPYLSETVGSSHDRASILDGISTWSGEGHSSADTSGASGYNIYTSRYSQNSFPIDTVSSAYTEPQSAVAGYANYAGYIFSYSDPALSIEGTMAIQAAGTPPTGTIANQYRPSTYSRTLSLASAKRLIHSPTGKGAYLVASSVVSTPFSHSLSGSGMYNPYSDRVATGVRKVTPALEANLQLVNFDGSTTSVLRRESTESTSVCFMSLTWGSYANFLDLAPRSSSIAESHTACALTVTSPLFGGAINKAQALHAQNVIGVGDEGIAFAIPAFFAAGGTGVPTVLVSESILGTDTSFPAASPSGPTLVIVSIGVMPSDGFNTTQVIVNVREPNGDLSTVSGLPIAYKVFSEDTGKVEYEGVTFMNQAFSLPAGKYSKVKVYAAPCYIYTNGTREYGASRGESDWIVMSARNLSPLSRAPTFPTNLSYVGDYSTLSGMVRLYENFTSSISYDPDTLYLPSIGVGVASATVLQMYEGRTGKWVPFIGYSNITGMKGYVAGLRRFAATALPTAYSTISAGNTYADILARFTTAANAILSKSETFNSALNPGASEEYAAAVPYVQVLKQEFIDGSTNKEKTGEDPPNKDMLYQVFIDKYMSLVTLLRNDFASPEILFRTDQTTVGFGFMRYGEQVLKPSTDLPAIWNPAGYASCVHV